MKLLSPTKPAVLVADSKKYSYCLKTLEKYNTDKHYLAVDTERASGFSYFDKAFLIQLKVADEPIFLLDPLAFTDLSEIRNQINKYRWILHSAPNDIPCLAELGITPKLLFDTELSARFLGFKKVNLSALCTEVLGITLEKEFSAVNWSSRPLPKPWLNYAALDVELLSELHQDLQQRLVAANKLQIFTEECHYLVELAKAMAQKPIVDFATALDIRIASQDWRHTKDIHRLKSPRELAMLKELWIAREKIANAQDISPARLFPDQIMVTVISEAEESSYPISAKLFTKHWQIRKSAAKNYLDFWITALANGRLSKDLPDLKPPRIALPPVKNWQQLNIKAWNQYQKLHPKLLNRAKELEIPVELLISPRIFRKLIWENPDNPKDFLAETSARNWQISEVLAILKN